MWSPELQVLLHVDEASLDAVLEHLLQRKLYGLAPGNVLVLPIPRFCGFQRDEGTALHLAPDVQSVPRSAGSGIAMLSCGWADYAFRCDHSLYHCHTASHTLRHDCQPRTRLQA